MRKVIFFTTLFILLLLVPVTALHTTPLVLVLRSPATLTNYIQRVIGLIAFTLLFVQIILGAFMDKLTKKLGGWVFKFHVIEGTVIYCLAFLHPLFFMIFNHFISHGWNPYLVFIDVCLLCDKPIDYYYTLGRISFWLLTITVLAAKFRTATPWLKANWRKLHVLNYLVFLLVGAHGFLIGTDFKVQPFYSFAILAYGIVTGIVLFIEIPRLYRNYNMSYLSVIERVEKLHKKLFKAYPNYKFQQYVQPIPYDACPRCQKGRLRSIHGRYGYFQGCSNYPACTYTKHLN